MHLQTKLITKVLDENYKKKDEDISIEDFSTEDGNYSLTKSHLRTITSLLQGQLEPNITFDDEKFFIAGGSVLTMLMYGSPFLIRDIDIFPCSQEDYDKLNKKLTASIGHNFCYENENSKQFKFAGLEIDLVKKFYPTLKDCLSAFDLSVVKVGFTNDWKFEKLVPLRDIFNFKMKLNFNVVKPDTACTVLRRVMKYSQKGFQLQPIQLIHLLAVIKSNKVREGIIKEEFELTSISLKKQVKEYDLEEEEETTEWGKSFKEVSDEFMKGYHTLVQQPIVNVTV